MPLANGEPVTLLDAIEASAAPSCEGVRVHQMHALHDRPYLHGAFGDRLRHVSYFLSHVTRPCFHAGTIDLVPNNFSEMRDILRSRDDAIRWCSPRRRRPTATATSASALNADYVASFIGRARFFLEANRQMPRTFGRNQMHVSQVVGWTEADYPLVEVPPAPSSPRTTGASPASSPSGSPTGRRSRSASGRSRTRSSPPWSTTATSACTPS